MLINYRHVIRINYKCLGLMKSLKLQLCVDYIFPSDIIRKYCELIAKRNGAGDGDSKYIIINIIYFVGTHTETFKNQT